MICLFLKREEKLEVILSKSFKGRRTSIKNKMLLNISANAITKFRFLKKSKKKQTKKTTE